MKGNCKVRFIVGKRGCGKSYLARTMIANCKRVLCYDSNRHDYTAGVVCDGLSVIKSYWRRVVGGPYQLIYRSDKPRADFDTVCKIVMAAGDTVFVVDEVDMYFDKGEPSEAFSDVIRRGRHNDIDLVGITQRPRQMGEIRSMANEVYIFETHEPSDLQYFKQSFSEKLVEMIKRLKQFEYVKVILPYDENALVVGRDDDDSQTINGAEIYQQQEPCVPVGLQPANGNQDCQDQPDTLA